MMTGELSPQAKFTRDVRKRYLRILTQTGRKYSSALAAGVVGQTVAKYRNSDPAFAEAEEAAMQLYRDHLEEEIYKRAVDGVQEPVYQAGKRVFEPVLDDKGNPVTDQDGNPMYKPAFVKKYSDRMLELHAKRHIAEYREKSTVDLNARGGILVVPGQQADVNWEEIYSESRSDDQTQDDSTHKQITRG